MRKFAILVMVMCAVLAETARGQAAGEHTREILLPGQVRAASPIQPGHAAWFGLYRTTTGAYELRPTAVRVREEEDLCGGQRNHISTSDSVAPELLIAGLPDPRAGKVDTAFTGMRFIKPSESLTLRLGRDQAYELSAKGTMTPGSGETIVTDYSLLLTSSAKSQIVATFRQLDWDGPPVLLWAGDLDRDGRIDMLADLRSHYAGHRYVLFLSSSAGADDLLAQFAEMSTLGC